MELEAELDHLRRRHTAEMSDQLRDARAYGGGSNNDEYHALREEQMVAEARIALLEESLARAAALAAEHSGDDTATVGSTVVIEDLSAPGTSRRYQLVGPHSRSRDSVSAASPMGQALLGASPGSLLTVDLPNGRSRAIRLVAVGPPDSP